MNHEVDLKNSILRTDLAVELVQSKPTKYYTKWRRSKTNK